MSLIHKYDTIDYFSSDRPTLKGFRDFCGRNISLIISVTIGLFFTFGSRLLWYNIGADTERYMAADQMLLVDNANTEGPFRWIVQGRFGIIALQKLLHFREFNPYTANFVAFCLIWLFTITWCYILAIFDKQTRERSNTFIPFALVFMTSVVWAEQFYWTLQAPEVAFIVFLCPLTIYLLFDGIFANKKFEMLISGTMIFFMISVYQAIVPLFVCGCLTCFLFFSKNSQYDHGIYIKLCLKLILVFLISLICYFVMDKIITEYVFNTYHEFSLFNWSETSIRDNFKRLLVFGWKITIGGIPILQTIAEPFLASHADKGVEAAKAVSESAKLIGNPLLIPIAIGYIIAIFKNKDKDKHAVKPVLYILAGIGVPICIVLLPIIRGGSDVRSQFVLPFATAFMLFYLCKYCSKKIRIIALICAILISFNQAEASAQLFYSDYIRYQEDVKVAYDLDEMISNVQPDGEKLPVAMIGKYTLMFEDNYLMGEALGRSLFEWASTGVSESGRHALPFMQSLGINYELASEAQMDIARSAAESMPSYPNKGCVILLQDMVVVKLSGSTYKPFTYE